MLSSEYENFKMAKEENVKEMYGRLSNIVYKSKALGKTYTELEIVRKILRVLPRSFEAKVTAIQESKDLKQLKVEELIGNLTTYELEMKFKEEREEGDTRKKSIALKGTTKSDDDDDDDGAEELELLIKKFKKWNRKHGNPARNQEMKSRISKAFDHSEEQKFICYNCNKPGHIKPDCPQIKLSHGKKQKKKSFAATWDEIDENNQSTGSESEKAELCLRGDTTDSDDDEPSEVSKLTHSELLIYFHEINGCYERLREKYAKLESQKDTLIECNEQLDQLVKTYQSRIPKCDKCPTFEEEIKKSETNIKSLENEILILKENENIRRENSIKKCTQLLKENESLKTQVQQLSTTLDKFSKSEKSLNMLLGKQTGNTDRQGLGYNKSKIVESNINQVNSMCTICRKYGHNKNKIS
jgi:hypothetical protein